MADPGFPRGGVNSRQRWANLLFCKSFAENCSVFSSTVTFHFCKPLSQLLASTKKINFIESDRVGQSENGYIMKCSSRGKLTSLMALVNITSTVWCQMWLHTYANVVWVCFYFTFVMDRWIMFYYFFFFFFAKCSLQYDQWRIQGPLRSKIFLFSCSFWGNLANLYVGAPLEDWRPLLWGILDPPLMTFFVMYI